MADDADKGPSGPGQDAGAAPEKRLEEVLAAKWDPGKLSKFMKGSQTSRGQRLEAQDGTYEIVADWWGVETTRGTTEAEFVEELNQKYAYQRVVMACEEQGYTLEETKNEEDGKISLTVKKWE